MAALRIAALSLPMFALPVASQQPATPAVGSASPSADIADFIVNIARYTFVAEGSACHVVDPLLRPRWGVGNHAYCHGSSTKREGGPVVWQAINAPLQAAGCNMVWLNSDVRPAPREWLKVVNDQPILTLSDYADFTADGGIIGAYRVGPDWRFEINLEALQRSRINIAAVALRLSQKQRVTSDSGAGK